MIVFFIIFYPEQILKGYNKFGEMKLSFLVFVWFFSVISESFLNHHLLRNEKESAQKEQEKPEKQKQIIPVSTPIPASQAKQEKSEKTNKEVEKKLQLIVNKEQTQYYVDIEVESNKYKMGLSGQNSVSWLFTNLTKKHEICVDQDCEESSQVISCKQCSETGQKEDTDTIAEKHINVNLKLNNTDMKFDLISAEVVKKKKKTESIVAGMMGISEWTYTISQKAQTILLQKDISQESKLKLSNPPSSVMSKIGDDNIKVPIEGSTFAFSNPNSLMRVPNALYEWLISEIKTEYLQSTCTNEKNTLVCDQPAFDPQDFPIQFCFDQICWKVNVANLVERGDDAYQYNLLFKKEKNGKFIFYPSFLSMYSLTIQNGSIASLLQNPTFSIGTPTEVEDEQIISKSSQSDPRFHHLDSSSHSSEAQIITTVHPTQKQGENSNKYSSNLVFFIIGYGAMAILILVVIKSKVAEIYAGRALNKILQAAWFKIAYSFFNRRRGYSPSNPQENQDEIDYPQVQRKKYNSLFQEGHQAEGI